MEKKKATKRNLLHMNVGNSKNPMNIILESGHDKCIQISFNSKSKRHAACYGSQKTWIPPPAKSSKGMKMCSYKHPTTSNEITLTLPEDGKFLLPHGLPVVIESTNLENFKAAIYPQQISNNVLYSIKDASLDSLDDSTRRIKKNYEQQFSVLNEAEKFLKRDENERATLSKQLHSLKKGLKEMSKSVKELTKHESDAVDKESRKIEFHKRIRNKCNGKRVTKHGGSSSSLRFHKPSNEIVDTTQIAFEAAPGYSHDVSKTKGYVQPTEVDIPPDKMKNKSDPYKYPSQPPKNSSPENVMIKLADTMRQTKLIADDVLRLGDCQRKYIQGVEELYDDQQKILKGICNAFKCDSTVSSDESESDPEINTHKNKVFVDSRPKNDFEKETASECVINSIPEITSHLGKQNLAEQLALVNLQITNLTKEIQLLSTKYSSESKSEPDTPKEEKQRQQKQKEGANIFKTAADADRGTNGDTTVKEVIGNILHKYNILKGKECNKNIYETTIIQKVKNFSTTDGEAKPEHEIFSNKEYLDSIYDAKEAVRNLDETIEKLIPLIPKICERSGVELGQPISISHREEETSGKILRERKIGRQKYNGRAKADVTERQSYEVRRPSDAQVSRPTAPCVQGVRRSTEIPRSLEADVTGVSRPIDADVGDLTDTDAQEIRRPMESYIQEVRRPTEVHKQGVRPTETNVQEARSPRESYTQEFGRPVQLDTQEVRKPTEMLTQEFRPTEMTVQEARRPADENGQEIRRHTLAQLETAGSMNRANLQQRLFPAASTSHEQRFATTSTAPAKILPPKETPPERLKRSNGSLKARVTPQTVPKQLIEDNQLQPRSKGSTGFEVKNKFSDQLHSASKRKVQHVGAAVQTSEDVLNSTRINHERAADQQSEQGQNFQEESPSAEDELEEGTIESIEDYEYVPPGESDQNIENVQNENDGIEEGTIESIDDYEYVPPGEFDQNIENAVIEEGDISNISNYVVERPQEQNHLDGQSRRTWYPISEYLESSLSEPDIEENINDVIEEGDISNIANYVVERPQEQNHLDGQSRRTWYPIPEYSGSSLSEPDIEENINDGIEGDISNISNYMGERPQEQYQLDEQSRRTWYPIPEYLGSSLSEPDSEENGNDVIEEGNISSIPNDENEQMRHSDTNASYKEPLLDTYTYDLDDTVNDRNRNAFFITTSPQKRVFNQGKIPTNDKDQIRAGSSPERRHHFDIYGRSTLNDMNKQNYSPKTRFQSVALPETHRESLRLPVNTYKVRKYSSPASYTYGNQEIPSSERRDSTFYGLPGTRNQNSTQHERAALPRWDEWESEKHFLSPYLYHGRHHMYNRPKSPSNVSDYNKFPNLPDYNKFPNLPDTRVPVTRESPTTIKNVNHRRHTLDTSDIDEKRRRIKNLYEDIMS